MRVERDIAGFAIPFASGAFIAAYTGRLLYAGNLTHITISLAVTLGLTALLMHPVRHRLAVPHIWVLIVLTGVAAGLFTGFHGKVAAISSIPLRPASTEGFAQSMKNAIDSIPFARPETNALIKALLTGASESLSSETIQTFRKSGASHILALSGLHLGIIYGIVKFSLSTIGNSRTAVYIKALTTVAICGFYTLATGAGPSIVRAFIFISLNEAARAMHRYHSTGNILMASLILQIAISPTSVRSAGFQLSYAAMAGIAFIYPYLKDFWPSGGGDPTSLSSRLDLPRRIWESAALSISCQITTGPIAYLYFRSLPTHFILTNLIALPLTTALIPAALVTTVLQGAGICPNASIRFTEWLAQGLLRSLEIIATM